MCDFVHLACAPLKKLLVLMVTDGLPKYHMPNEKLKESPAYQALARIDDGLKELSLEERLRERQQSIKSLVGEYFI